MSCLDSESEEAKKKRLIYSRLIKSDAMHRLAIGSVLNFHPVLF